MALISLSSFQLNPAVNGGYDTDALEVRWWYSRSYIDSSTVSVQWGNGTSGFYIISICTVDGNGIITVPSTSIYSTLDAIDPAPQSIQFFGRLFSNNTPKQWITAFSSTPTGWVVQNPTPLSALTYEDLVLENQALTLANPPQTFWTIAQTEAYIASLTPTPLASDVAFGRTKLDVAPASATNPIAVGANSYATTTHSGIGKSSVTRSPTSAVTFVETTDSRVTADQAANVASIRTLGSGPLQAAAGTTELLVPDLTIFSHNYASLNLAVAAMISMGGGTVVVDNICYLTADVATTSAVRVSFQGAGIIASVTGAHTATFQGPFDAPNWQVFGTTISAKFTSTSVLQTAWWGDKTVTVPAPASAPVLTAQNALGGATYTNGVTYQVAYSYVAWNGETGLSPVTSFIAVTNQAIAVLPKASLANTSKWAVGSYVYISADGGVTFQRADGRNIFPLMASFGDDTIYGGVYAAYNGAGTAPQAGGTTTTTKAGKTVSPPTVAPTVNMLMDIPAATYYGAYAYVAGDGTTSALSPISSGAVITAGKYLYFQVTQEPPSGACAVNLYLGTTAAAGSLHLQQTVPLHYVTTDVHTYNVAGAVPSTGTAQSVISGFQQAYDAAMNAGGGVVSVSAAVNTQVPIILRLKNDSGTQVVGIKIQGSGHDVNGSTALARINYTGTITGVDGVVSSATSLTWSDLDFYDPNGRVKYALAGCDFTGGGGFDGWWYRSTFRATAAASIGYQVSIASRSASSHTTSEQHFIDCTLWGKAWGIDLHGSQTGDMFFDNINPQSDGDSNSANSGSIRLMGGFNVYVKGAVTSGAREYGIFLGSDSPHPLSATSGQAFISNYFADSATVPPFDVHASPSVGGVTPLTLAGNYFQSSGDADQFALYANCPLQLTLVGNLSGGGNGWVNFTTTSGYTANYRPNIVQIGPDNFFGLGATYSFKLNSPVIDYTFATAQTFVSAIGLINASGNQSTIQTNAAGDLVLAPYTGITSTTSLKIAATGKLETSPKTGQTYSNAMTIDVTISNQVLAVVNGTSATSTWTPSAAGTAGDWLFLDTSADASGTVTVTFAATFHSSGTQATTASHFSSIAFKSNGTLWVEQYRTTNLA